MSATIKLTALLVVLTLLTGAACVTSYQIGYRLNPILKQKGYDFVGGKHG